jgi:hypothetical protein
MSHPGDTGMRKEVDLYRGHVGDIVYWFLDNNLADWHWACRKVHGRWTVGDAHSIFYGSVAGKCPGWAAAGAVFDLSSKLGQ